ncbi:unnamed protein product [Ilex paraguariensis]
MSVEELKIRSELEMDVERDLEEEIMDKIYHLALRLHRLYQQQKERKARELSEPEAKNQRGTNKKTLSEVNINIRMEGGTKIEIKEIKKDARESRQPWSSRSDNGQAMVASDTKKFNWEKTLRSGPCPVAVPMRSNSSNQAKVLNKKHSLRQQSEVDTVRKNGGGTSGQRKAIVGVQNRLLELEWRS